MTEITAEQRAEWRDGRQACATAPTWDSQYARVVALCEELDEIEAERDYHRARADAFAAKLETAERLAAAYKAAIADVERMPMATPDQRLVASMRATLATALLTKAQVHATLAQTAATIELIESHDPSGLRTDWQEAVR